MEKLLPRLNMDDNSLDLLLDLPKPAAMLEALAGAKIVVVPFPSMHGGTLASTKLIGISIPGRRVTPAWGGSIGQ